MIEYYAGLHCDLTQIGGLLDAKSYGIGLQPGSEFRELLSDVILELQDNQVAT